ncbi:MAG: DUF1887 family protein [Clostridia bacterium]|nr:DUF1887 family protein [Clostridia bacterium]
MTIIEFFDSNDIENIAGTLLCAPEKTIFIGDNYKKLMTVIGSYKTIVRARKLSTEFEVRTVNRNDLKDIVSALRETVNQNSDCVIDLTGGDELYLVAAGIVSNLYPDKVSLHRFNIRNGMLYDCDDTGCSVKAGPASVDVCENIAVYGGRVVFDAEKNGATHRWDFTDEFKTDIRKLWNVYCDGTGYWNSQVGTFSGINAYIPQKDPLCLSVDKADAKEILSSHSVKYVCFHSMLKALEKNGLINGLVNDKYTLSFRYKNEQIKNCLTKAGLLLELYVTVTALECSDKNGRVYNDVQTGVVVDWDGMLSKGTPDVENEIDVILMKDLIPVFISCKNGAVDITELYKLETVAKRFGGKYAKKVLVASELNKNSAKGRYIALRAQEMGIRIIDNVDKYSAEKLNDILSSLWKNS